MTMEKNYPLHWPHGWQRTSASDRTRAKFGSVKSSGSNGWKSKHDLTMQESCRRLIEELHRLGTDDFIISTNVKVRLDGLPYSDQRKPEDCGVAVYFRLDGTDRVLACDKWDRVEDNIAAVAAHIDAIRRQERYGVGTLDQAFAGYTALPAPANMTRHWSSVLDVRHTASLSEIKAAYSAMAKKCHPDGPEGSHDKMAELNAAYDQAKKERNAAA